MTTPPAASNWIIKRVRPRHYVLLQAEGSVSAVHFLISLSLDDESEYVRLRDPDSGEDRYIHHRSPIRYDKESAEENIRKAILEKDLPPLDMKISFDELFGGVDPDDDNETRIPSLDDYG